MENFRDLKLYIIGESEFSLFLLEKQLNNKGIDKVYLFSDLEEGLQHMNFKPDVIFINVDGRPCNCGDRIKEIKQQYPGIYLVLLAEPGYSPIEEQLKEFGIFECLTKDNNVAQIIENSLKRIHHIITLIRNAK